MKTRTVAIALGVALAVSVGVNLFAATAAFTVLSGPARIEPRHDLPSSRPSAREVIGTVSPEARGRVREALRAAARRAQPEFQAAREARRQAIEAAGADPLDASKVASLLEQSRAAETRGRRLLESDTLAILGTLGPADRAIFARILNGRSGGAGGPGRGRDRAGPLSPDQPPL